jgi:hypothetical protein
LHISTRTSRCSPLAPNRLASLPRPSRLERAPRDKAICLHKNVRALHISCSTLRHCNLLLADLPVDNLIAENFRDLLIAVQSSPATHQQRLPGTEHQEQPFNISKSAGKFGTSLSATQSKYGAGLVHNAAVTHAPESALSLRWRGTSLQPRGNVAKLVTR